MSPRASLSPFVVVMAMMLVACGGGPSSESSADGGADAACPLRSRDGPPSELGDDGNMFFSFLSYLSAGQSNGTTDYELTAGGSVTLVALEARGIAPPGLTVKSVGPAPATLTLPPPQQNAGGCGEILLLEVTTGPAGLFDLVVDDANGVEYDRKTFTSVMPAHLGFADTWPSPAVIFIGSTQYAHADTLGPQGEELRGTGAVHFMLGGVLVPAMQQMDLEGPGGDEIYFSGGSTGLGELDAQADGYAEHASLTVVDGSAITSVVLSNAGWGSSGTASGPAVSVEALAGSDVVYGAECMWTTSATVTELWPSALGRFSQALYMFQGPPGRVSATCAILGGPTSSIQIDLPDQ